MTLAVCHFDGILDIRMQVERNACSQEVSSWPRFLRNSVWMLSFPGALPFLMDLSAIPTSSKVKVSDVEVHSGVDWRSFLISRLTEREWVLVSVLRYCHFPLFTSTEVWSKWTLFRRATSASELVDCNPGSAARVGEVDFGHFLLPSCLSPLAK